MSNGRGQPASIDPREDFSPDPAGLSKFGIFLPTENTPGIHQTSQDRRNIPTDKEVDYSDVIYEHANPGTPEISPDITALPPETRELHRPHNQFSRAMSMPVPGRLKHLEHPHRATITGPAPKLNTSLSSSSVQGAMHSDLSLELADSVQIMIQTLLQISPSQVLDPAKEQYSACSLSVPTTSISALFSSMKHLNYMSANLSTLYPNIVDSPIMGQNSNHSSKHVEFDIGEVLQMVGDSLSGLAAQKGVDLVLFHTDVGLRHASVKGDECGLSYALTNIIRQIIATAWRGDSIEVELGVQSQTRSDRSSSELPHTHPSEELRCVFNITHNFIPAINNIPPSSDIQIHETREHPQFDSLLLRRLISHVGANFSAEAESKAYGYGRTTQLSLTLYAGESLPIADSQPVGNNDLPGGKLSEEPSVDDLAKFAETLKGRKVTLYAGLKTSFAHHLTSYLTAWGMDVNHVSELDPSSGPESMTDPLLPSIPSRPTLGLRNTTTIGSVSTENSSTGSGSSSSPGSTPVLDSESGTLAAPTSFILIDDDVQVLRERLQKLRLSQGYSSRKRPSLAAHHRPKSSPHLKLFGLPSPVSNIVILHFTSLANYKSVQDVLQTDVTLHNGTGVPLPEVMIIPKPAGPRRCLTALHTAVTRPLVDPFFTPIATSPSSSGSQSQLNFNTFRSTTPLSPVSQSAPKLNSTPRTSSDRSAKSPKEPRPNEDPSSLGPRQGPTSPFSVAESTEYFNVPALVQTPVTRLGPLGPSLSSGLLIQSPDGQPTGIIFQPKSSRASSSTAPERPRTNAWQGSSRTNIGRMDPERRSPKSTTFSSLHAGLNSGSSPRPSTGHRSSATSDVSKRANESEASTASARRLSGPDLPREAISSSSATATRAGKRLGDGTNVPATPGAAKPSEAAVVPPISVLIVDDNPINQTILSTFMRKKKIKYDVAKNGLEAVEKWKAGGYHLIFMDIQMPVMNGIEATKEIRRLERVGPTGSFMSPHSELSNPLRTPSDSNSDVVTPHRSSVIIVALTASSLTTDRVAALSAGCNDFLTKPVSLEWLNNKIIEWGSIKVLQMWGDHAVKSMASGQAAQAQAVAKRLHVPERRTTISRSPNAERLPLGSTSLVQLPNTEPQKRPPRRTHDSSDTLSSSDTDKESKPRGTITRDASSPDSIENEPTPTNSREPSQVALG